MIFAYKNFLMGVVMAAVMASGVLGMPDVLRAQDSTDTGTASEDPLLPTKPTGTASEDPLLPSKEVPIVKVQNPLSKVNNLTGFIKILLEGVIKIGIPLIALALVYAGFMLVSATGNPDKIKKGKDAFVYALIGGAILLGSWAIAQMISDTVLQLG